MTVNETTGRHLAEPSASAPPDDLVTRLLCAACYLHDDIADSAEHALLTPTRRALSPNWQVDQVALARHAARATGLRNSRDSWLNREVWYVSGMAFLALLLTVSGWLSPFYFVLVVLFLAFWGYVVAVGIVYYQMRTARRAAIDAATDPGINPPPPLRRVSTEEMLRDLNHCNAVLYRGDGAPFVGSGVKLDSWQITIDISHVRPGSEPVTGAELQAALHEMLPQKVSPRPSAEHRLYVRGGASALTVDLYRNGPLEQRDLVEQLNFRRPVAWMPPRLLRQYVDRRDENVRVYTCFQQATWGGQVVVSLFVHAHVANDTLFIEGQVYALRPLHAELLDVRSLPSGTTPELQALGPIALSTATSMLTNAPSVIMKKARLNRLRTANAAEADNEIANRRDVDFGAVKSVREQVSNFDLGEHFAAADEELYYQVFTRRVMESMEAFLESRGVETAEFSAQSGEIVSKATANARSLYGDSSGG